jgi:hypothetical protein
MNVPFNFHILQDIFAACCNFTLQREPNAAVSRTIIRYISLSPFRQWRKGWQSILCAYAQFYGLAIFVIGWLCPRHLHAIAPLGA